MEVDVNAEDEEPEEEEGEDEGAGGAGYNYLLGMPLWSLTHEKVEAMKKQLGEKTAEYEELLKITTEVMWWNDLAAVETTLDHLDATKAKASAESAELAKKEAAKKAKEAQEAAEDEAMAQGAEADRLTSVEERQKIQYYSQSFEKWLRARVIAVAEDGQFMIDLKEGDWFTAEELTMEGSKFKAIPKVKPVQRDEFGKPISEAEAKEGPPVVEVGGVAVPVEEIEEESEAEEAEEEEEEKKGKKGATNAKPVAPAVVPELTPFVARPRPEDRFTYRSKLKAKEEPKKKGPSAWTQAFAADKAARDAKKEATETQAEVRARRMAEREAAKAAREAAKLEEAAKEE